MLSKAISFSAMLILLDIPNDAIRGVFNVLVDIEYIVKKGMLQKENKCFLKNIGGIKRFFR